MENLGAQSVRGLPLDDSVGIVVWITGLAGAGKSTIARELVRHLRERMRPVILLDGDQLRDILGAQTVHTIDERANLAMRYARLCKEMADQGAWVVCATISMFEKVRQWNRQQNINYFEVYLKVSMEDLIQRDQKALYSRALNGEIKNVMGVDLPVDEPVNPDMVIENSGIRSPEEIAEELIQTLQNRYAFIPPAFSVVNQNRKLSRS